MKRGIVASAQIITPIDNGFRVDRRLNMQEIGFYTLYWDRVVLPTNAFMHVGVDDEDLLVNSGLIERPRVKSLGGISSSQMIDFLLQAQVDVIEDLIKSEQDIDWVMHQIGNELTLPKGVSESRKTLRFKLVNALPVPAGEILIPDIIDFKERRRDELNTLHASIDELYLDVLRSPDQDLASRKAFAELNKSLGDLSQVTSEKWKRTSQFDFSVNFNLEGGKFASALAAGAAFDFFNNGFSLPIGTIVAPVVSLLSVKAGYSTSIKATERENKFSYLASAHSEGIIR